MSLAPPPDELDDAPPAARHLYRLFQLAEDDSVSQRDLAMASGYSTRWVRDVMPVLIEAGLVSRDADTDARQVRYALESDEK